MSDWLDRKVALKNSVIFLILSKLPKIMYFFLTSSNYRNTGVNFNLLMRQKKPMENIMTIILEDLIMSDGLLYLFVQLFFNTEKVSLNWRLDSTVTDYVLLIFIVIPLW